MKIVEEVGRGENESSDGASCDTNKNKLIMQQLEEAKKQMESFKREINRDDPEHLAVLKEMTEHIVELERLLGIWDRPNIKGLWNVGESGYAIQKAKPPLAVKSYR